MNKPREEEKELTMDLEKVKKQMPDQMPGLDWTKIPEFGETTWGEMLDGFLDEVIPKLLSSQLKEVRDKVEKFGEEVSCEKNPKWVLSEVKKIIGGSDE